MQTCPVPCPVHRSRGTRKRSPLARRSRTVPRTSSSEEPCRVEETTGAGNERAGLREKLSVRETADLRLSKEQTLFVRVTPYVARRQSSHCTPSGWPDPPT